MGSHVLRMRPVHHRAALVCGLLQVKQTPSSSGRQRLWPFPGGRRRRGAACAPRTCAVPYSPPSASPCMARSTASIAGAQSPIMPYVGRQPMRTVGMAMAAMLHSRLVRRPAVSPTWPNSRAPTGLAMKPTAYTPLQVVQR